MSCASIDFIIEIVDFVLGEDLTFIGDCVLNIVHTNILHIYDVHI